MSTVLPFWSLGYSAKLREQTVGSFRAGLTKSEFQQLVRDAGLDRTAIRTHFLTHQSLERAAFPYRTFSRARPAFSPAVRAMKSLYVSRPRRATV